MHELNESHGNVAENGGFTNDVSNDNDKIKHSNNGYNDVIINSSPDYGYNEANLNTTSPDYGYSHTVQSQNQYYPQDAQYNFVNNQLNSQLDHGYNLLSQETMNNASSGQMHGYNNYPGQSNPDNNDRSVYENTQVKAINPSVASTSPPVAQKESYVAWIAKSMFGAKSTAKTSRQIQSYQVIIRILIYLQTRCH